MLWDCLLFRKCWQIFQHRDESLLKGGGNRAQGQIAPYHMEASAKSHHQYTAYHNATYIFSYIALCMWIHTDTDRVCMYRYTQVYICTQRCKIHIHTYLKPRVVLKFKLHNTHSESSKPPTPASPTEPLWNLVPVIHHAPHSPALQAGRCSPGYGPFCTRSWLKEASDVSFCPSVTHFHLSFMLLPELFSRRHIRLCKLYC